RRRGHLTQPRSPDRPATRAPRPGARPAATPVDRAPGAPGAQRPAPAGVRVGSPGAGVAAEVRSRSGVGRNRRSRRLLLTTNTLDSAMAAPASIGLSCPVAATGRAATL